MRFHIALKIAIESNRRMAIKVEKHTFWFSPDQIPFDVEYCFTVDWEVEPLKGEPIKKPGKKGEK